MARVVVVGSFIQDLVFRTETLPSPGETRIAQLSSGPGGKGSNQAIACRRQGAATLFVGAVGDDALGRAYADLARAEGLETALEVVRDHATGAAAILVDAAARNMIAVALGASGALSSHHIELQRPQIEGAAVLLTQLEANLDATLRALEIARSAGVLTILNPAPIHAGLPHALLEAADILTPNETEFTFLLERFHGTKLGPDTWQAPDAELGELCDLLGAPTVVLTLGAQGCFVAHRDAAAEFATTARLPAGPRPGLGTPSRLRYRVAAPPVNPVDTTGAGDALSGALAAALASRPRDFVSAVVRASAAAGLSTERHGAALSMPDSGEVSAFLATHRCELDRTVWRWS